MEFEKPIIRVATPSDTPLLTELAEKTFRDAFGHLNNKEDFENYVAGSFTEVQIRSELMDDTIIFFIARLKDEWAGYAKLHQSPPPDCVQPLPAIELSRLYSKQQYLGCGVGHALMAACINHAQDKAFKSIWLGSWQENHRGNAFYAKMQFDVAGTKTFALGTEIQEDYIFVRPID